MTRHRHGMDELQHFGLLSLSRVVLSDAVAGSPAGTPLEEVLSHFYDVLTSLEGAAIHEVASFNADATIAPRFTIDAVITSAGFWEDTFERTETGGWGTTTSAGDAEARYPFTWFPWKHDSSFSQHGDTIETIYARMAVGETEYWIDEATGLSLPSRPYWRHTSGSTLSDRVVEAAGFPSVESGTFVMDFYHLFDYNQDLVFTYQSSRHCANGFIDLFSDGTEVEVSPGEFAHEWWIYADNYNVEIGPIYIPSSALFVGGGTGDFGSDYEVSRDHVLRVKCEFTAAGGTSRLKYWFPYTEEEPGTWAETWTTAAGTVAYDNAPTLYLYYSLLWNITNFPDAEVGGPSYFRVDTDETEWIVYRQFTADAFKRKTQTGSFTANAVIAVQRGSVSADAILKKNITSTPAAPTAGTTVTNTGTGSTLSWSHGTAATTQAMLAVFWCVDYDNLTSPFMDINDVTLTYGGISCTRVDFTYVSGSASNMPTALYLIHKTDFDSRASDTFLASYAADSTFWDDSRWATVQINASAAVVATDYDEHATSASSNLWQVSLTPSGGMSDGLAIVTYQAGIPATNVSAEPSSQVTISHNSLNAGNWIQWWDYYRPLTTTTSLGFKRTTNSATTRTLIGVVFQVAGGVTADAVITARSYTADAVKRKAQSGSFTANAILKKTSSPSFTIDAVLYIRNFTADAVLFRIWGGMPTLDAYIVSGTTFFFNLDAITKVTQSANLLADAVRKVSVASSFTADAIAETTSSANFTADAWFLVSGNVTDSFDADAVIQRTQTGSFTADAIVQRSATGSFDADAEIVGSGHTGSFLADAIAKKTQSASFTADAERRLLQTGSFTANARVAGHIVPSLINTPAWVNSGTSAVSSVVATLPGSLQEGDFMVIHAAGGNNTALTINQSWSTGAGVSGSDYAITFYKVHTGTESNPTISRASGTGRIIYVYKVWRGPDAWVTPTATTASSGSTGVTSLTGAANITLGPGDIAAAVMEQDDNLTTWTRPTNAVDAPSVTWTGNSVEDPAAHYNSGNNANPLGTDIAADAVHRTVAASSAGSSGAPTQTSTTGLVRPTAVWLRVRGYTPVTVRFTADAEIVP